MTSRLIHRPTLMKLIMPKLILRESIIVTNMTSVCKLLNHSTGITLYMNSAIGDLLMNLMLVQQLWLTMDRGVILNLCCDGVCVLDCILIYLYAAEIEFYMWYTKQRLRFIDTLQFFQQPLADLSSAYNIDTVKGYVPHHSILVKIKNMLVTFQL